MFHGVRLCSLALVLICAATASAATFTVTTTANSGAGSLRTAIDQSNANAVADTITFAAGVSGKTIVLGSTLPALTGGQLTINGDLNNDGTPDIGLDGASLSGDALAVRSASNTIRGLWISRCGGAAIALDRSGSQNNKIVGCFLGTNKTGQFALGNRYGVLVTNGAKNNQIGGTTTPSKDRNVISGNHYVGILIAGANANKVLNNRIGLNVAGDIPIGNGTGVLISDSENCVVGNASTASRNVIAANSSQLDIGDSVQADAARAVLPFEGGYGVFILRGAGHVIAGNHIGTTAAGDEPLFNGREDIQVRNASTVRIGGTTTSARNIIGDGVEIQRSQSVTVLGNNVGVGVDGTTTFGAHEGVHLLDSVNCAVGSGAAGARNVVGGISYDAVQVDGGRGNLVQGNFIGLNRAGTKALLGGTGIAVYDGARNTQIGGSGTGVGNIFAGQDRYAIEVQEGPGTVVQQNRIGFQGDGTTQMPIPATTSIYVSQEAAVGPITIGGTPALLGNTLVVESGHIGIHVLGAGVTEIRNNTLTGLIDGVSGTSLGIRLGDSFGEAISPRVIRNTLEGLTVGLEIRGTGSAPVVVSNTFDGIGQTGILINSGTAPNLGDRGNAPTNDDGNNVFVSPGAGAFDVKNNSANAIKAEGNDWNGETVAANIDATHIFDQLDNASLGRVDFDPLISGNSPSSAGGAAHLTGLTAAPGARGAEIVFALSAAAEVQAEVLNLAGRPVAALSPVDGRAGLNRLAWSGLSAQGTAAPAGVYLIRLTARTSSGAQSSALTRVQLAR
jgi:parallel beta-helix repeat protein